MVQYYTLEQAAQILRTTPDKLREMAKRNEVRAFQDRGSLRFRAQEIDELARTMGLGSDTDININVVGMGSGTKLGGPPSGSKLGNPPSGSKLGGPASGSKVGGGPLSGPKTPGTSGRPTRAAPADHGARNLSLDDSDSDEVPIGAEPRSDRGMQPSSTTRKPPSKPPSTKSAPPKPASDSDVRLVMEGSDLDFTIDLDHGPKSQRSSSAPASPRPRPTESGKLGSGARRAPLKPDDSDVKGVRDVEDVAVGEMKPKAPSDSDVRLEGREPGLPSGGRKLENVTEEIDLDAEQAAAKPRSPAPKPRAGGVGSDSGTIATPKSSGRLNKPTSGIPAAPPASTESSDFELSLEDSSPVDLGSDELKVKDTSDDEVDLGGLGGGPGATGINLKDPADSGISLEEGGSDEIEFELSLDATEASMPPSSRKLPGEEESTSSSSEFDLNLEAESSSEVVLEGQGKESKGSEFELTLDDEGGLAPLEPEAADSGEKEIFETDFDVPVAPNEPSAVAELDEDDTDLESSDFDLQLDESGSEAVAVDEADTGEEAAGDEAGFEEELEGEAEGEEEVLEEPVAAGAPAPQPWGVLPVALLVPSVLILFVVLLMSFELVQGMWTYHQPGKASSLILNPFARMVDDDPIFKD